MQEFDRLANISVLCVYDGGTYCLTMLVTLAAEMLCLKANLQIKINGISLLKPFSERPFSATL